MNWNMHHIVLDSFSGKLKTRTGHGLWSGHLIDEYPQLQTFLTINYSNYGSFSSISLWLMEIKPLFKKIVKKISVIRIVRRKFHDFCKFNFVDSSRLQLSR